MEASRNNNRGFGKGKIQNPGDFLKDIGTDILMDLTLQPPAPKSEDMIEGFLKSFVMVFP